MRKPSGRNLNSPVAPNRPLNGSYGALVAGKELDDEDFNLIRSRFEFSTMICQERIEWRRIERDSLILKNIEDVLQDYPL